MKPNLIAAALMSLAPATWAADLDSQLASAQKELAQFEHMSAQSLTQNLSTQSPTTGGLNTSYYDWIVGLDIPDKRVIIEAWAVAYESYYIRGQQVLDMVRGMFTPSDFAAQVEPMAWWQDYVDRVNFYGAEAAKYRAWLATPIEVERTLTQRVESVISEGEWRFDRLETREEARVEGDFENLYRIDETYEIRTISEAFYEVLTTTITFNDGSVETEESRRLDRTETRTETRVLTDEVLVASNPIVTDPRAEFETAEFYRNYGLDQINAQAAYAEGFTGLGVDVGVFDSGIAEHEDLVVSSRTNYYSGSLNDHGTHVAGIIAAQKNDIGIHGVAYGANLHDYRVLGSSGSGSTTQISRAVGDAVGEIDVANLSLGATITYTATNAGTLNYWYGSIASAVRSGMTVVVAAGNSGKSCLPDATGAVSCSFPAAIPAVAGMDDILDAEGGFLSVGAVDKNGNMPSWSNRAGVMKDWYLVAPGVGITSTSSDGGTEVKSGTSMAAPHVSGAAALLMEKFPNLSGNEIAEILLVTAEDLGAPGVDEIYGHGLLDLEQAMQPVGAVSIPTGSSTAEGGMAPSNIALPSAVATALADSGALDQTLLLDSYDRNYTVDATDWIIDAPSFSFASALSSNTQGFGLLMVPEFADALGVSYANDGLTLRYMQTQTPFETDSASLIGLGDEVTHHVELEKRTRWNDWNLAGAVSVGFAKAEDINQGLSESRSDMVGYAWRASAQRNLNRQWSVRASAQADMAIVRGTLDLAIPTMTTLDDQVVTETITADLRETRVPVTLGLGLNYSHKNHGLSLNLREQTRSDLGLQTQLSWRLSF